MGAGVGFGAPFSKACSVKAKSSAGQQAVEVHVNLLAAVPCSQQWLAPPAALAGMISTTGAGREGNEATCK